MDMDKSKDSTEMLYSIKYGKHSPEVTVNDILYEQAMQYPDKIALDFEGLQITYGELNKKSNQLARVLRKKGVKPNDFVALLTTHSIEMIIAIYAVIKAGGAYVPINVEDAILRQSYILNNSEAKILLTNMDNVLLETSAEIIPLTEEFYSQEESDELDNVNTPNDLLYLIYTSGTTGKPKGVMVEHRNLISHFFNSEEYFHYCSSDVFIMFHTYCFDASVWEIFGAGFFGAELVILSREIARDIVAVRNIIQQEKVTVMMLMVSMFYSLSELDFNPEEVNLRILFVGGERLNPLRMKSFHSKLPQVNLYNVYGPTETTILATYKKLSDADLETDVSNIGTIFSSLFFYVMNGIEPCIEGESGELCIGGAGLSRGYWREEELTSKKFINSPFHEGEKIYRTGDLVRLLPNGDIEFIGRVDNQVKIRGYRIEVEEIENRIRYFPGVRNTVVKPYKINDSEDTQLVGYVSFSHNDAKPAHRFDTLINYLSDCIPKYMIPIHWIEMDQIPLLSTGKTDRNNLPNPQLLGKTDENNYNHIKDPIQRGVMRILGEILHITDVRLSDTFFSIGGHSLLTAKLQIRLNEEFGILIPIIFIYSNPTVVQIVNYIKNHKSDSNEAKENLVAEIGNVLNLTEDEYIIFQEGRDYLLFIEDIKYHAHMEDYSLRLKKNISKRMPLYIFPLSLYKKEYQSHKDEWKIEKIAEQILKENYKSGDIYRIIKYLYKELDEYKDNVISNPISKKYDVSPSQLLSFELEYAVSNTQIEFKEAVDIEKMERAWAAFIQHFGLLRSSIIISDDEKSIVEHECNKVVKLPFIDITYYSKDFQDNILDAILYTCNEYKNRKSYNNNHLTNRIVLVKLNENNYRLILVCTHLIFDGFSSEIFESTIRGLYEKEDSFDKGGANGNYKGYTEFIKAGPKDASEDEIMEEMNLYNFKDCLNEYRNYIKSKDFCIINYCYPFDSQKIISEEARLLIAGKIFSLALKLAFENQRVPIFYIYSGRIYNGACFTNYLGEFIDLIPLVIDTCKDENFIKNINTQLEFIRRYNINMATFKFDDNIMTQYPKVTNTFNLKDMMNTPIFNYIGLFKNANELENHMGNNGRNIMDSKLLTEIYYTENNVIAKIICIKGREEELRKLLDDLLSTNS